MAQAETVKKWIELYNSAKSAVTDMGPAAPRVNPFTPFVPGKNTVNLAVLDPALTGMTITFNADIIGTGGDTLRLSNITVNTAPMLGVQIVHPLWVIWDANNQVAPDPIDSFGSLDAVYQPATMTPLGAGTVFLPGWKAGSRLSVEFTKVEPKMGTVVPPSGCKATNNFQTNVRMPFLTQCYGCHQNGSGGFTLSAALSAADACNSARGVINTANPAQSLLLSKPNPAVAGHGGANQKIANYNAYQTAVTNWINLEK
jgi:hypothetical protein